jgi:glutathione S-transferase
MQGQATHFRLYAPEPLEYPQKRYTRECERLYRVLERRLAASASGYLVGDRCTLADLAHYGWVACAGWSGVDLAPYPHVRAWEERMRARPAIAKARNIPDPYAYNELAKDKAATEKFTAPGRKWFRESL